MEKQHTQHKSITFQIKGKLAKLLILLGMLALMTRSANIIAVTSGKGGVGKTHISANLGILLAKQGRRTCVIDADYGLANINLILGLPATNQPKNLFESDFDIESVMIKTEQGLDVLPSASGISQNSVASPPSKKQIEQLINQLKPHYDVILIDTSAGIDNTVKNYLSVSDHVLLVINSEPTSLTDGFGLIRKMKDVQPYYNVIINRVTNAAAATGIYKRFASAVRKYIGAQVGAIGYISEDSFMSAAVLSQTAVVSYSPNCLASQCLKRISRMLSRKIADEQQQQKTLPEKITETIIEEPLDVKTKVDIETSNTIKIPLSPSFIRTHADVDPFEAWVSQLSRFLDNKNSTNKTRTNRTKRLINEIEKVAEQDSELLAALEDIVVNISIKNSKSIMEQANIADRLAQTRFVEEPSLVDISNRHQQRNSGVARAFSIISKLK